MRKTLLTLAFAASAITTAAAAQTVPPAPPPPGPGSMMRGDPDGERTITRADYIARAEARFAAMDTDHDGKLTVEERRATREAMRGRMRGGADAPPPPPPPSK